MNEELFNEAAKSNVLTKKLIDQLQESMTYSSISFINWTIEVLTLIKNRLERGDRITDEVSGEVYTTKTFQKFVKENFSSYITSQVFKEIVKPEKISDDEMTIMARDISKRIEDEMDYPGQIKINLIREKRVVEYAK